MAHTGVLQAPMHKGHKRVHRFVVLPDFQGIGIGMAFINAVAQIYHEQGLKFTLITTTPQLTGALRRSDKWALTTYGRETSGYKAFMRYNNANKKHLSNKSSNNRITYSFRYKG